MFRLAILLLLPTAIPADAQTAPAGTSSSREEAVLNAEREGGAGGPSLPGAAASDFQPSSEMTRAVEIFRVRSEQLGLQPAAAAVETRAVRPANSVWHGRLYENCRNNFLDAVPHEIVQRGGERGLLRRNQFGFNLTGPVVIPRLYNGAGRTFFSFSYEGMRESIGRTELETVPTMEERLGEWGHVVDRSGRPLPIYDPATTTVNPAFRPGEPVGRDNLQYNRLPFPENRIPTDRLDAVAQRALKHYPAPNSNAGPFFRNNYFIVAPEVNRADGFIARVDHTFRERHWVTVTVNRSNGVEGSAPIFLTIAEPEDAPQDITTRGISVEHIFTASPAEINTLQVGISSDASENQTPPDETGQPFPLYDFDPYQGMGRDNPNARDVRNRFEIEDTFSMRRGSHRLTLGGEANYSQFHSFRPRFPSGRFEFTPGLTSLPGIVNTGHAFASFLLGQSSFAQRSVVVSPSYFRGGRYRLFAADQWQITPSLTLTIGLDLDISTPRVEKYDRQSNIAFDAINPENGRAGALVVANQGDRGRAFQRVWTTLSPRAGLAWNLFGNNSTVLRLNYSREYESHEIGLGYFGTQAFNGTPAWISENPQLTPSVILAEGLKGGLTFPDVRPEAANGTVADLFDVSGRQPMSQEFGVSIQRQLPGRVVLTVEAEYEHARNQFVDDDVVNPNAIPLAALQFRDQLNDLEFNKSLRPFPQYQRFDLNDAYADGRSRQTGVEFGVEKRSSGGLSLSASYEFTRVMDDYSSEVQDFYNRRNEWSRSARNSPHEVTFTYMYELPFGPNKAFLNFTDWRRLLLEGWSVSGVVSFQSGEPLVLEPQFNNTGGVVNALRVNAVPGVDAEVADRGPEMWFNPAAFAQPDDFTIGNLSRTHPGLLGPGRRNHDMAFNKRFAMVSDRMLEFSMSAFNVLNQGNWNEPDTEIGPASSPNVNAGRIIGSQGGRVIQLGLRFSF